MDPKKLGDSYDLVKKVIIHGLAPPEHWDAHPMYFNRPPELDFLNQYELLLGIGLVEGWNSDRDEVCAVGQRCQKHLILDPDTGLRVPGVAGVLQERPRGGWNKHIRVNELAQIATAQGRKPRITLVYDQCYSNASFEDLKEQAQEKLNILRDRGIYGSAYVTHVAYIFVSACQYTAWAATNRLINCTRLPRWRFVGDGV